MVWFNYITAFRSNLDDAAQEEEYMPCRLHLPLAVALLAGSVSLQAQETVIGASDPDALFHSRDPRLDANKQVVYHIVKNLLEAGYWELGDRDFIERVVPHQPTAACGVAGVV